jgi:Lrp/AsnC family transcriptional regulator for asnA, asnC and gidA
MKINSMIVEIDGIDKNFEVLMEDARKPILQIANKIGFQELLSIKGCEN